MADSASDAGSEVSFDFDLPSIPLRHAIVALRSHSNLSDKTIAKRLEVHEWQVKLVHSRADLIAQPPKGFTQMLEAVGKVHDLEYVVCRAREIDNANASLKRGPEEEQAGRVRKFQKNRDFFPANTSNKTNVFANLPAEILTWIFDYSLELSLIHTCHQFRKCLPDYAFYAPRLLFMAFCDLRGFLGGHKNRLNNEWSLPDIPLLLPEEVENPEPSTLAISTSEDEQGERDKNFCRRQNLQEMVLNSGWCTCYDILRIVPHLLRTQIQERWLGCDAGYGPGQNMGPMQRKKLHKLLQSDRELMNLSGFSMKVNSRNPKELWFPSIYTGIISNVIPNYGFGHRAYSEKKIKMLHFLVDAWLTTHTISETGWPQSQDTVRFDNDLMEALLGSIGEQEEALEKKLRLFCEYNENAAYINREVDELQGRDPSVDTEERIPLFDTEALTAA